jgi:hypothetical protein
VSAAIVLILLGRIALRLLQHAQNEAINESRAATQLEMTAQPAYVAPHEK